LTFAANSDHGGDENLKIDARLLALSAKSSIILGGLATVPVLFCEIR